MFFLVSVSWEKINLKIKWQVEKIVTTDNTVNLNNTCINNASTKENNEKLRISFAKWKHNGKFLNID